MLPIQRLSSLPPADLESLLGRRAARIQDVMPAVLGILSEVRRRGDHALRRYTARFDGVERSSIEVSRREVDEACSLIASETLIALVAAAQAIWRFHEAVKPQDVVVRGGANGVIGRRVAPYDRVGVYVPGGRAAYPSTVLMGAIPARVAGVREVVLCSPPRRDGSLCPEVLAAARIACVDRIFCVGGAQAIAAMTYGTETVPAVEKIVGPGNLFVTAAKHAVRDRVGIDFLAGPTEVLVISDGAAPATFAAADLVSQAEHDPEAVALLVTTSLRHAREVGLEVEGLLEGLPRRAIAEESLRRNGRILIVKDLDEAVEFSNRFAPEHLVLMTRSPWALFRRVRHAGAVFLGRWSPVSLGDFCAGPNHVLPTAGAGRLASGLSTSDFVKTIAWQEFSKTGLRRSAGIAEAIAAVEGLEGHARAVRVRARG